MNLNVQEERKNTQNEKRYETFKMQIHAADEVYICFVQKLRYQRNGTGVLLGYIFNGHSHRSHFFVHAVQMHDLHFSICFNFFLAFCHTHANIDKLLINYAFG